MKDFLKKNILPLLSLLISVITLLLFWCRFSPFTWDSFGATTAVMGVIVTFLVGFQIGSVIDTSRFKAEIKAEQKEIKSCFEEKQRLIEDKLKYIVLKQKDSDYTYSYYFAKIYGQSLNLPEYIRYSLQAVYYGLQCNAKQYTEACNELIKGVNSVMKITQGLTVTESMQETLLQDFYKAKGVSEVEGFDNKELEELGKSIIIASIVP